MNDPVWNIPEPTIIAGRAFTVRELPLGSVIENVNEFFVVLGAYGDITRLESSEEKGGRIFALVHQYVDKVVSIVAESSQLTVAEVLALPASVGFDLAAAVLTAQEGAVRAFFRLQATALAVMAPNVARGNGSSDQPRSSSGSSAPDLTTTTSSGD